MLNRVSLIGRLAADPEVNNLGNGGTVVKFRLAVSERWKDRQTGEAKERTEWVPCVCWNEGLGRVLESFVKKGQLVYVEGAFQTRSWEKDGEKRYTTEVVMNANAVLRMLGGGERGANTETAEAREIPGYKSTGYTGRSAPAPISRTTQSSIDEDSIPFSACWQ